MKRFRSLGIVLAAVLVSTTMGLLQSDASAGPGKRDYQWGNVAIGGGGYVTGMVAHPAEQDLVYIRTDVGGAYRWNPKGQSWTPITDWIKADDRDLYRIESIAVAPTDTGTVYLAGGDGVPADSAIMKSTDLGKTWTMSRLGIAISGNPGGEADDPARSSGERLAVDPGTASIVYYGSRNDGLWRSTNAGATWARDTRFPVTGAPGRGLAFILFGHSSEPAGTPTSTIYAAVYGDGIYHTTDAGETWTRLDGSPAQPNRAALAADGTLYVTHKTGVARLSNGTWSDITPVTDLWAHDGNTSGVQHAWRATDGGYEIELAIPWANLGITPTIGGVVGFDIGNNDDDNGSGREGQGVAFGTADNWKDTSAFGDLTLLDGMTPSANGIGAAPVPAGEITVDGSITETAWSQGETVLPHSLSKVVSGTWNNTVRYSVLWNSTYLYVAAKVTDEDLYSDSSNVWDDDSIEVYVDGDHNQGSSYDAHDNQYIKGYNRTSPEHNAISADPANPAHLITATAIRGFNNPLYESFDSGTTWAQISYIRNNTVPWWPDWHWSASTASLTIDPLRPGRVWYTDWYGVWRTDDITASPSVWTNFEQGHEEAVVVSNITSPPSGSVLLHSGVADNGGYDHTSLTSFPTESHRDRGLPDTTTTGIDFSEANPHFLVRIGRQYNSGDNARGGYSTDGGNTYTPFPSLPEAAGRVAVSATSERIVWAAQGFGDGKVRYSSDRGTTWSLSAGAPSGLIPTDANWVGCQPLASDRAATDTFYIYHAGRFYRSTDGGATFNDTGANGLPNMPCGYFEDFTVKAAPGIAGEVWINFGTKGLYRSTDHGSTFTKLRNVSHARAFGFGIGKSPGHKTRPAIYLHGVVNGADGIFRSDNLGKHWTKINKTEAIGCRIKDLTGDRQNFGRLYIATDGRGIYYGNPTGS